MGNLHTPRSHPRSKNFPCFKQLFPLDSCFEDEPYPWARLFLFSFGRALPMGTPFFSIGRALPMGTPQKSRLTNGVFNS